MKHKLTIPAVALVSFLLGACIFSKNHNAASPLQLLQLLAQTASCWVSAGNTATTACSIGIGGATPNENTKLAVNGRISSSVLGVYCGKTSGGFTGSQVGGYTGAKAKCETACGNTNAHMCSAHELVSGWQNGISTPLMFLWYSGGLYTTHTGGTGQNQDCGGWKLGSGSPSHGPATDQTVNAPNVQTCDMSLPIACCL